jgi:hypothetical protein
MDQPLDHSNIDWNPLKKGGANFKTHKLVELSTLRLEYKASLGYKLFAGIFLMIGIIIPIVMMMNEGVPIFVGLFGLLFLGAGAFIYKTAMKPIVFDKSMGYFWKGKKDPHMVVNIDDIKTVAKLDEIYGIQVIKEYVKSKDSKGHDSSYYSYEINLILNSGKRLNVVDCGNATSILQDASQLSKFLDVRVLSNS